MALFGPKKHTDRQGDESEAVIIAKLLEVGYNVLTPLGKNHRYDLVIEDADGKFRRVQCKTGWTDEGMTVINFATASSYNHTAKQKGWRNYRGQVEYFAVYCPDTRGAYLIPVDQVGITQAKLRLVPTANKQEKGVRWAKDYEL